MSLQSIFIEKSPVPSSGLPLTLISLQNWILIKVKGKDIIQYLHNQFTCDIKNLNQNQYSFSAHCNYQGKMISNMYVFHVKNQEMAFIEPINVSKKQVLIMQKYAIFSDVMITPDYDAILIGVAGLHARKYLSMFFKTIPDTKKTIVRYSDVILLYFSLPIERFLLIINDQSLLINLLNKSKSFTIKYNNHYQWIALDIEAGYPYIDSAISELFIPQAANMDILQGISFKKGCYLGQELIARIQYHKLNKQALYQLSGNFDWNKQKQLLPVSGDHIELQINNQYWKKVGTVLQSCRMTQNNIWIQAILNKSILKNHQLRIHNSKWNSNLNIYVKNI